MKRKNYTLIEILTVVFIIGLLAAMGAPAAMRMISKKKTLVAKQEIEAIVKAIKQYEAEYGKLPFASANTSDVIYDDSAPLTQTFIEALLGKGTSKTYDATNNSRGVKFLTWTEDEGDGDGTVDNWIDPWGNPYIIGIDYDYSGEVDLIAGQSGYEDLKGSIFVYSKGEDEFCGGDDFNNATVKAAFLASDLNVDGDTTVDSNEITASNSDNICSWK